MKEDEIQRLADLIFDRIMEKQEKAEASEGKQAEAMKSI